MATMNLRISGSKTKKIAVKLKSLDAFPSHCQEFFERQKNDLSEKLPQNNAGRNLFELICQARSTEEILQEMKKLMKMKWPINDADPLNDESVLTVNFLFTLYLLSDYQSHVKNAILRFVENGSTSGAAMEGCKTIFRSYLGAAKSKNDETCIAGTVMHLAKCAKLAEIFILPCWNEEIEFFSRAAQSIRHNFQSFSELSPVEQQVLFNGLHLSSQAAVVVLQLANKKCSTALGATEALQVLFSELAVTLLSPPAQLPSDTLNSCAMAALLASDRIEEKSKAEDRILDVLAIVLSSDRALNYSGWGPLRNSSNVVKFSLAAALLGVHKPEDLAVATLNNHFALSLLFSFLATQTGQSSESSDILGGCRAIAALGRVLPPACAVQPELLEKLLPQATEHCIVHLEHHMDSVRHATKAFLASLLAACQTGNNSSSVLINCFKNLPIDSKSRFFGISALGASLGTAKVLEEIPDIVEWLLSAAKITTLAPHSCSTFEVLMKHHITPDVLETEWCETWILPIVGTMPCPALDPVMAKAFQLRHQTLHYVVALCSNELPRNGSGGSPARLKILLSCLTLAKKYFSGNLNWTSVIEERQLTMALSHSEDKVKLAALSMLSESRKITEILRLEDLAALRSGFRFCCDTEAPSTCHNAVSIFKKVLCRLSSVKRGHESFEDYAEFLSGLCFDAFSGLFPGASLCRRSFALQTLCLIRDFLGSQDFWMTVWQRQLTSGNCETLLGCLSDTYDSNKKMALDLLKTFPIHVLQFDNEDYFKDLLDRCVALSESHRPPDCAVAACVFSLISECDGVEQILQNIYGKENSCLILCQNLLERLKTQLGAAKQSILRASVYGPMYGTLFCLRSLIVEQNLVNIAPGSDESSEWKALIDELVPLCFEMNQVVAPVVNSSSPEGHLPMDFETDFELSSDIESMSLQDGQARKATAQMVLLCAWRTVKEVSLTLGDLAAKAPASEEHSYLLTYEQLLQIGEHFTTLLCETKHRGAFEQAYVGFCKLCAWLWKVPNGKLPQLPATWLDELIKSISSDAEEGGSIKLAKLCTTRRSAGVPFIVQALISTELEVRTKPECFHRTVVVLMRLARDSGSAGQLHALNILRALFRSAHLGEHVASFVSEGFVVAIAAFKSTNWAERNSATLLFSALMGRVFGVKHTPGHEDLPRKNRMTGRIFFRLYPDLFNLLSDELKSIAASIRQGQEVAASLYPVLLLLSRLYPSSLEGTDSALNLLSLLDYVSDCTASPVMHTRELAAKALVPLVDPLQAAKFVESLDISPQSTNKLHGKLLQLAKLAKEIEFSGDLATAYAVKLKSGLYLIAEEHQCQITKGAFIDIALELSSRGFLPSDEIFLSTLLQQLPNVLQSEESFGFVITQQKAARLWLEICSLQDDFFILESALCDVLRHPTPEVVHEACIFILTRSEGAIDEIDGSSSKFLRLPCRDISLSTQLKSSTSVAHALMKKALEFTPDEGQAAQFETRIAIYFSCLRLGSGILQVEWCHNGVSLQSQEQKLDLLLRFVEEQNLGPASHMVLAFFGELINDTKIQLSSILADRFSATILDCALDDQSVESNLVVAQILRKNRRLLFETHEKASVNSFCAAMIALQISSPSVREVLLQVHKRMHGLSRSRALHAMALWFAELEIKLELKVATLLVWAFGESLINSMNGEQNTNCDEEEQKKVFEQGEVAANAEELKQCEAAAVALAQLMKNLDEGKIRLMLKAKLDWVPMMDLKNPITCREMLMNAKSQLKQLHFLDLQHNFMVLNTLRLREIEKTGMFNFL